LKIGSSFTGSLGLAQGEINRQIDGASLKDEVTSRQRWNFERWYQSTDTRENCSTEKMVPNLVAVLEVRLQEVASHHLKVCTFYEAVHKTHKDRQLSCHGGGF
jgi:hypothetical protein